MSIFNYSQMVIFQPPALDKRTGSTRHGSVVRRPENGQHPGDESSGLHLGCHRHFIGVESPRWEHLIWSQRAKRRIHLVSLRSKSKAQRTITSLVISYPKLDQQTSTARDIAQARAETSGILRLKSCEAMVHLEEVGGVQGPLKFNQPPRA